MTDDTTASLPAVQILAQPLATRASTDEAILASWLDGMASDHTRANFERTARAFLARLPAGLRGASVEDVRDALAAISAGAAPSSARQYVLRVKSLLSYAHRLGYLPFNAGAVIKVRNEGASRGAQLAKRIISDVQVALLIRAGRTPRDRIMLATLYAGGLRVSELAALTWGDVIAREGGRVQLTVLGKGGLVRQVLLPTAVAQALLILRGEAPATAPVFASGRSGLHLTPRAIQGTIKRSAKAAGIREAVSPHWLRHAHASHAIDRGATLPEVQATLGHSSVQTTGGYLHARPGTSSGLRLDVAVALG